MDEKLKETIEVLRKLEVMKYKIEGYSAQEVMERKSIQLVISTLTRLYEQEAPEILHNNITPGFVEEQFPKDKCRERGQALVLHAKMLIWFNDLITLQFNKLKSELEQARKFDCWKWLLSWLKSYDELNKTDVGDKIYQWIQEQPMTSS